MNEEKYYIGTLINESNTYYILYDQLTDEQLNECIKSSNGTIQYDPYTTLDEYISKIKQLHGDGCIVDCVC